MTDRSVWPHGVLTGDYYGTPPRPVGDRGAGPWHTRNPMDLVEHCTYLYLPVCIPGTDGVHVPRRLRPLEGLVQLALLDAYMQGRDLDRDHVYLTVKHGYATPGNPLNRPGWHCDGFGTDDLNYVWWSRWATRFAVHQFPEVTDDHHESMRQFERYAGSNWFPVDDRTLYALTPYVVHTTPEIPAPGGMRLFVKISFSRHRYNLIGNSHNYALDYDWEMFPREVARNDPAQYGRDYYEEPTDG